MPKTTRYYTRKQPGEPYTNRAPGIAVLNCSIPHEAKALLLAMAPTPKSVGEMVARLVYAEAARREEKQRLLRRLTADDDKESE
jgi:hypothetical protein